jgi:peptide/nickel transport system permease protein
MKMIQSVPIPLATERTSTSRKARRRGLDKAVLGGIMVGVVVLVTFLSIWVTPYGPEQTSLSARLQPGIWAGNTQHLLGTDQLGRDMLSRVMAGGRISLTIAFLAVLGSGVIGTVLGLAAAFYRGVVDNLLSMLAEIQLALPGILLIMLFLGVLGPSIFTLALVLAIDDWIGLFRVTRSRVLVEKARDYTDAARVIGASNGRIIFRHLLPNILPIVMVLTMLSTGSVILTEAGLSFLGLGVQRPFPSWGRMIADGQEYLLSAWWVSTLPALTVAIVVVGVNFLGDGLRELAKAE